jgi:hypothetical protein
LQGRLCGLCDPSSVVANNVDTIFGLIQIIKPELINANEFCKLKNTIER